MRAQLDLCYKVIAVNNNNINAQMQAISGGNGLNLSKFNDSQTLLNAAEAYYYLGYSVIPLLGDVDPARPKVAARSWSVYQQRLATFNEFHNWFSPQSGAAALGIVTGRISRLVVLDFDSPDLFADFRRRFPDLLETHTVQSAGRGLPHLYFHLPPHLHLTSHKRQGVDLLSDGRYVIAPPTTINGSAYRITRGGMPRTLTTHDIQRLQSFLTGTQSRPSPSIYKEEPASSSLPCYPIVGAGFIPPAVSPISPSLVYGLSAYEPAKVADGLGRGSNTPSSTASVETPQPLTSHPISSGGAEFIPPAASHTDPNASVGKGLRPFRSASLAPLSSSPVGTRHAVSDHIHPPSRAALHGLYIYWCSKGGRNDALFRTALYARDHGMNENQTRHALVSLYVSSPLSTQWRGAGGEDGLNESPALRQREASATIGSAFSRPPRPIAPTPSPACGLSAHEPAKVADGSGWGLPNTVCEALMQRKLTYVVRTLEGLYQAGFRPGRGFTADQAIQALKGIVGRDSVYNALNALTPNGQPFFPQRSPSALPQASKEAARQKQPLKTKKCFFVTEKNSGIKKRGPKQRIFKFPTIANLCKLLGVKISASDPLTRDDLTSAHQTRMALQRELIKRRPGEYTYRWMAKRLGVSRRTISTYNRLIPIHSQPTYHETVLSWTNINVLLSDEVLSGSHIETILGKKYPALRAVAANLLAKGTFIRLKQRKGNLYWYGSNDPPPNILSATSLQSVGTRHAVSAPVASPTPSPACGGGLGWGLPASPSSPAAYLASPAPLSSAKPPFGAQWRGAGGEDIRSVGTRHAVSAANPSPALASVGEGLRPSRSLPSPLPPEQQETLAQTIYERVNQSNDGSTKHLSLKNARKLVRSHTEKDIQFALQRLGQRTNLANPTGFFVTVLRSTARANEF